MPAPLENLLLDESDRNILHEFLESCEEHGGPVLFAGAGLSRYHAVRKPEAPPDAEVKDWEQLISTFSARAPTATAVDGLVDPLRAAQKYEDELGRLRLVEKISAAIPQEWFTPGPAHRALCKFTWAAVITTNYDTFIEQELKAVGLPYVKVVDDTDLQSRRERSATHVIKMHGCLDRRDSIVLALEDYEQYENTRPFVLDAVRSYLYRHSTLFVGCSLTDPNVRKAIEWTRRSGRKFTLPSVALVHELPSEELRTHWHALNVHLVYVPPDVALAQVLDALYRSSSPAHRAAEKEREPSRVSELMEALVPDAEEWPTRAVEVIAKMVSSDSTRERREAVYRVLYGGINRLDGRHIREVLDGCTIETRKALLLEALRTGVTTSKGRDKETLDVEARLLTERTLTPSESAEVQLLRIERAVAKDDFTGARHELASVARDAGSSWSADLHGRIRRIAWRIGDEAVIRTLLRGPPRSDDPFEYAQRGADSLVIDDPQTAERWYRGALERSQSADATTAAVLGLQACRGPGDWLAGEEIDPDWPETVQKKRPRVDAFHSLQSDAGNALLAGFRERCSPEDKISDASEALHEALQQADDMGWPRMRSPNFTGLGDNVAYAIFGLLTRKDAPIEDLKNALDLFVTRGLLRAEKRIDAGAIDALLRGSAAAWTREFLSGRDEASFRRRSRALLASAVLPALPDDLIDQHVESVIHFDDIDAPVLDETPATELHLQLLRRHYPAMPTRSAAIVLRVASESFSQTNLRFGRHYDRTHLPLWDWNATEVIVPNDPAVQALVAALIIFYESHEEPDGFANLRALQLIDDLMDINAIVPADRTRLATAMDSVIARYKKALDDVDEVLPLIQTRNALGSGGVPPKIVAIFTDAYRSLRNSTAAGRWFHAVELIAPFLPADDRAKVVRCVDDYLELTLQREEWRHFGPYPEWAAFGIQAAARADLLAPKDAWERMLRLINSHPEWAGVALDMPEPDVAAAMAILLEAARNHALEENALLRWCVLLPRGSEPNEQLERILFGGLFATTADQRRTSYWSLGWLARNAALSELGQQQLRAYVLEFGQHDPDWKPRAAARVAAAGARKAFTAEELRNLERSARADAVAGVRRAGGFLGKAVRRGLSRRTRR